MLALISVCSDSKGWHGQEDIVLLEVFNNSQLCSEDASFNLQKNEEWQLEFQVKWSQDIYWFREKHKNSRKKIIFLLKNSDRVITDVGNVSRKRN